MRNAGARYRDFNNEAISSFYTENKLLQVNLRTLDLFLIPQNDERKNYNIPNYRHLYQTLTWATFHIYFLLIFTTQKSSQESQPIKHLSVKQHIYLIDFKHQVFGQTY